MGSSYKQLLNTHFYVKDRGFVNAGELQIGDELLDSTCNILIVEDITHEICVPSVTVYNFEVDDFHTYHVGGFGVLVHNADYVEPPKKYQIDKNGLDNIDDFAKKALETFRNGVDGGDIKKITSGKIDGKVVSIAVDSKTGKITYGISGKKPNNPTRLPTNDKMQPILDDVGTTKMPHSLDNCAEFESINNAFYNGSNINALKVYSVYKNSGGYKEPCLNCITLYNNYVSFIK